MKFSKKSIVRALFAIGFVMCGTVGVIQAQKEWAPAAGPKTIECIRNGDAVCLSEFLSRGGNARAVDEKGSSLLSIASETKSATVVRLLLNAGADANAADSGDETPLCRAALFGRKEIAQTLLEAGAKANVICDGDHGDSALMTAIRGAMYGDMTKDLKETLFDPEELRESADNQEDADQKVQGLQAPIERDYLAIARMLMAGADVSVGEMCRRVSNAVMAPASKWSKRCWPTAQT